MAVLFCLSRKSSTTPAHHVPCPVNVTVRSSSLAAFRWTSALVHESTEPVKALFWSNTNLAVAVKLRSLIINQTSSELILSRTRLRGLATVLQIRRPQEQRQTAKQQIIHQSTRALNPSTHHAQHPCWVLYGGDRTGQRDTCLRYSLISRSQGQS